MTTWVLVVFVCIGVSGDTEANALTSIHGFSSRAECEEASRPIKSEFSSGTKRVATVCVKQTKAP